MLRGILVFACYGLFMGCRTSGEQQSAPGFEQIAKHRFGESATFVHNAEGDYVLCMQEIETAVQEPHPKISFFVFDQAGSRVVFEESEITGTVAWLDAYSIEVAIVPGMISSESQPLPGYIVDVRTGERKSRSRPRGSSN
jgi:hypothetical protein